MMTTADHAAHYILQNWQPLAVRPNDKPPLRTGWQSESNTAIFQTLATNPAANIGIAVPAGMMVLDVDIKGNGPATLAALEAMHGALPATLAATTATGGKHIWLRLPPNTAVRNRIAFAPGLDVRTAGGYVVAPPSVVNGRNYSWDNWNPTDGEPDIAEAPGWLLAQVNRPTAAPKLPAGAPFQIPEGQRNGTLFDAAATMRAKGFSHEAILAALTTMNTESCSPALDDDEVARTAANAARYAPNAPLWEIFGTPAPLPAGARPPVPSLTPAMRYKLLSGADLCNAPPMRWMVRGVLPVAGLCAVYGPSGSGKSFLILDICFAVAGGTEWFDRRVVQAPVTYVCLEGEAGMGKRVKAWSQLHRKAVPDAARFITQPFDLLSGDVPELASAVIDGNGAGGMVIVDTLNRAAPGADENSSVDMGRLIAAASLLQSLVGGLVLLVHHTGKDSSKGLRGHSSLYAALDGAIEVVKTDVRHTWNVAKCKDDVTGEAYPFKLEIVPVGIDDQGLPITSCVAVPDRSCEVTNAKRITLGKNQQIARDVLVELLRKSPHTGKEGAQAGKPCVLYDEAVAIVTERMPTDKGHQKTSAKVAISGLVGKGVMGMQGDWLWTNW